MISEASTVISEPFAVTRAPMTRSTSAMVRTSLRSGTLRMRETPEASSVAAITGSTAFFAPEISTSPSSGSLLETL